VRRATVAVPQESSAGAAIAAAPGAVGSGGDYVVALTAAMALTALVVAVALVARKRHPHR
jgi:multisubunit Na+/H+ antiporter MnhC subunit